MHPGSNLVTTREVLAEEAALLETVKAGQGVYAEIGCGGQLSAVGQNRPLVVEIKGFKTSHFLEHKRSSGLPGCRTNGACPIS